MKRLVKLLIALVVIIIAVVLTLPLWDSPILRPIACQIAPYFTKTSFEISELHINEYLGRIIINGLKLENPKEYDQRIAFSLGHLTFDVDMSTALSDVVVIEKVAINDVFVSYVKDDKGVNNFDQIISNVDGGYDLRDVQQSKEYATLKEKAKAEKESVKKAQPTTETKPALGGRKFILDRLEIKGVVVQWGVMTMPVPPIVLTDVGRKEGGLSPDELWSIVYATFWRSLSALGVSLKDIGVDVGNLAGTLKELGIENTDKAMEAIKDIKLDENVKSVEEKADKAIKVLKGLFN